MGLGLGLGALGLRKKVDGVSPRLASSAQELAANHFSPTHHAAQEVQAQRCAHLEVQGVQDEALHSEDLLACICLQETGCAQRSAKHQ